MKQINFDGLSDGEFRELERRAWNGVLDFADFPAAEYKFFDTVRATGYRHRHEKYPLDFCGEDIARAREVYRRETELLHYNLEADRKYQQARIRLGGLLNKIYKSKAPLEKLRRALGCVELAVGEDGFAARNLSENYLETEENNG